MPSLTTLKERMGAERRISVLDRLSARVSALSPGDRWIAYVLMLLVAATSLTGLYKLERSVLVPVPAYGGSLTEGEVGSPRFVNPLLALSDADRDLAMLTYAGLMGEDGSGKLVPVLAESYEISPDGRTYTFALRKDATFSDGTPVTAGDVVFTVGKAQDPGLKSPEFADWSGVAAQVVDAHTVRFTLGKAYAPFLETATLGILPEHLWKDVSDDEFPFSPLMTKPVGAGPFQYAGATTDKDGVITEYRLKAFGGYALGKPYLAHMTFRFYADAQALQAALAKGAVESAYGVASPRAITAPYSRVFGVFWNSANNPALAREEVRHALSLAIDRDALAQKALGGYATPLAGPVPPGSGIEETPVPESADRVKDAAALLEDAGWTYDGDARQWKLPKEDLSLAITLKTSNVPELKAIANAVKADWSALGVPVDIELYEPSDLTQNVIRPRQYDALLFGMVIGRDRDLYAFWHSSERNDPGLNIALYANKSVDALLEDMRQDDDPAKETEDLQKINDLIAADYPAAFTDAPESLYTIPEGLKGVALPQIAAPSDRFAGVRNWHVRTDYVWPFLVR
jgi:peptide/nickel transport system substrate-binding protein